MSQKYIMVFVTVPWAFGQSVAQAMAQKLVEKRLAACVGILTQKSVYRWKEQVTRSDEALLVIKTTKERFAAVRDAVLAMHSYEVPEIISVDIEEGYPAYLDWIAECVRDRVIEQD